MHRKVGEERLKPGETREHTLFLQTSVSAEVFLGIFFRWLEVSDIPSCYGAKLVSQHLLPVGPSAVPFLCPVDSVFTRTGRELAH